MEIARKAGSLGNTYDLTTADSVILTTAIETGYTTLLTGDEHFLPAQKHGKVKIIGELEEA